MKRAALLVLIVWVLVVPGMNGAFAQGGDAPLLLLFKGDLWQWTERDGISRLTNWGYNWSPRQSPDGRYVAYVSQAQSAVEAWARQEYYPLESAPSNIWLYDLATGESERIAGQPEDAVYNSETFIGIERFAPQWSPDGTMLAWVQAQFSQDTIHFQLVVHDLQRGEQRVIVDSLPGPFGDAGFIGTIPMQWGAGGITTGTFGGTEDGFFGLMLRVYTADGDLRLEYPLQSSNEHGAVDWFWITDDEEPSLIVRYGTNSGEVERYVSIDPATGLTTELSDVAILRAAEGASGSLALYPAEVAASEVVQWWALTPAGSQLVVEDRTPFVRRYQFATAPDGARVAYLTDALYIWQDGEARRIPDTEQFIEGNTVAVLVWGAPLWQLWAVDDLPPSGA